MSNIGKKLPPNLSNKSIIQILTDKDFQLKCIQKGYHMNLFIALTLQEEIIIGLIKKLVVFYLVGNLAFLD